MAQNRQDMGSGPVKPLLLQLMIPAVVAQVVNLLYNIVDRIYIGHIEGRRDRSGWRLRPGHPNGWCRPPPHSIPEPGTGPG